MPSNKVNLETLPVASLVPTSARQSHPMRCRINRDALFEKAVKLALGGDTTALRMVLKG